MAAPSSQRYQQINHGRNASTSSQFPSDVEGRNKLGEEIELLDGGQQRYGTSAQLNRTRREIITCATMLKHLEAQRENFAGEDNPQTLIVNLEHDTVIRNHLIKLRAKLDVLEWRLLASKRSLFKLDAGVVDRLLDIHRETGQSTGALAALGASVSLGILYSATRGDLWYFYIAWWLFIASLALTSALAFSSSGSGAATSTDLLEIDPDFTFNELLNDARSNKRWIYQQSIIACVGVSLMSVVAGYATLACGVVKFGVHDELVGESPRVVGGPDGREDHGSKWTRYFAYAVIGFFALCMMCGYVYRLKSRVHGKSYVGPATSVQPK